jgi:hypothetical protein
MQAGRKYYFVQIEVLFIAAAIALLLGARISGRTPTRQ